MVTCVRTYVSTTTVEVDGHVDDRGRRDVAGSHERNVNLIRPRLLTPTVGVSNRHKVAIATDSLSIRATNKLLPPTRSVTLTTTNRRTL